MFNLPNSIIVTPTYTEESYPLFCMFNLAIILISNYIFNVVFLILFITFSSSCKNLL